MKKLNKFIAIILCLILLISATLTLAGCNFTDSNTNNQENSIPEIPSVDNGQNEIIPPITEPEIEDNFEETEKEPEIEQPDDSKEEENDDEVNERFLVTNNEIITALDTHLRDKMLKAIYYSANNDTIIDSKWYMSTDNCANILSIEYRVTILKNSYKYFRVGKAYFSGDKQSCTLSDLLNGNIDNIKCKFLNSLTLQDYYCYKDKVPTSRAVELFNELKELICDEFFSQNENATRIFRFDGSNLSGSLNDKYGISCVYSFSLKEITDTHIKNRIIWLCTSWDSDKYNTDEKWLSLLISNFKKGYYDDCKTSTEITPLFGHMIEQNDEVFYDSELQTNTQNIATDKQFIDYMEDICMDKILEIADPTLDLTANNILSSRWHSVKNANGDIIKAEYSFHYNANHIKANKIIYFIVSIYFDDGLTYEDLITNNQSKYFSCYYEFSDAYYSNKKDEYSQLANYIFDKEYGENPEAERYFCSFTDGNSIKASMTVNGGIKVDHVHIFNVSEISDECARRVEYWIKASNSTEEYIENIDQGLRSVRSTRSYTFVGKLMTTNGN